MVAAVSSIGQLINRSRTELFGEVYFEKVHLHFLIFFQYWDAAYIWNPSSQNTKHIYQFHGYALGINYRVSTSQVRCSDNCQI